MATGKQLLCVVGGGEAAAAGTRRAGHCLVTPGGGGGLSWAPARAQPPTHPTLPPPWGGSMPCTHSHIQAEQN